MNQIKNSELTFVFPNLHFEYDWDISEGHSLWQVFLGGNIVEPLFRVNKNSDYIPGVAESWYFSLDKKKLFIKIKKGLKFQDGTLITPTIVKNSLERALEIKKSSHSDIYNSLCKEEDCNGLSLDGDTLILNLEKPLNGLLFKLSISEFGIVPSSYVVKTGTKDHLKNLSGPYKLISFERKKVVLERNDEHYLIDGTSPKFINIVEINKIEDAIDFYNKNSNVVLIGTDYLGALKLNEVKGDKYISAPSLTEFLLPNMNNKFIKNEKNRKTLFSILEKIKNQISIQSHLVERTNQLFTKHNLARIHDFKSKFDNSSKLPDKIKILVFDWMEGTDIPLQLNALLKSSFNIEVDIEVVATKNALKRWQEEDFHFSYLFTGVSAADPIGEIVYLSKIFPNNFGKGKGLEKLIVEAKSEINRKLYSEKIKKIHEIYLNDARIFPILHSNVIYVNNSDFQLKNMNTFDGSFNLWDWASR